MMKKVLALTLLLVALTFSVCHAAVNKTYDEKNNRALIRSLVMVPATEIDPESTILINMKKIYFFDSRFYDNAIGRYNPRSYFTIAIMGNAAEKFENIMNYTINGKSYSLPIGVETKQNNKKQVVLSAGTCEFRNDAKLPFLEALKNGTPVDVRITMKAKKGPKLLKYTIEGAALNDMGQVASYDIYDDANFLNIAQKANQKPLR